MTKKYYGKTIGSFLIVLMLMPLGHALMIMMEQLLTPTALHYTAFAMGFAGLAITIIGALQSGDTRQTIYGITGAMLFWTGWVEFLLMYYAQRYGTHCDLIGDGIVQTTTHYIDGIGQQHDILINGRPLESYTHAQIKAIRGSRPEYLIMPATFGMWMMFIVLYLFCTRTGCNFLRWIQRHAKIEDNVELRPMAHHPSIIVFMEWNIMMWGLYLLLMFCYDPVFLGSTHPVTYAVAAISLISAILMLKKQIHISTWGRNIRFALATVIIFWTFVEIVSRNGFFTEVWVDPLSHTSEMIVIITVFAASILTSVILSTRINPSE